MKENMYANKSARIMKKKFYCFFKVAVAVAVLVRQQVQKQWSKRRKIHFSEIQVSTAR